MIRFPFTRVRSINHAAALPLNPADLTPFQADDICRDGHDSLCRIEQIGWCNQTSPYPLEAEAGILRAYVIGYTVSGRTWTDWVLVDDLVLAERAGARKFMRFEAHVEAQKQKTPAFASA